MARMARVEQITDKAQVDSEWHPLYERIAAARGRVAGPYSILLYAPAVADRVDQLSAALRADSQLTPEEFVLAGWQRDGQPKRIQGDPNKLSASRPCNRDDDVGLWFSVLCGAHCHGATGRKI